MVNVSKRQQPDQKAENSRRLSTGLQHSKKIPQDLLYLAVQHGFSCS